MATSIGQIALDLVVNQNQFQQQMNGITKLAKKAGVALAAAFGTKKLIDFGKQCLELGSDLAEVQNVVDVTFPHMTAKVDEFAKSAAQSFGLSETMAKQYTGTFGAMAKAFGFTEQQAYDMGSTLTGLAGDVASFYNLSQDEAYTKLKSVFTGETESLKDLGVVMTQTALDSYALANGFGKTTAQMTEAEKVSLRYAFVQSQLSAAQGDFARTSGSWANQVRILKLQFDSLKATIGQGLINLFTPIIKTVNTLIGKLATLANAFKSFTELITGNKSSGSSQVSSMGEVAADAGTGMEDASQSADNMTEATKKAGSAAKKAAKEMKALMGFDKINKLDDNSSDSSTDSGSGTGSSEGAKVGSAVDFGSLANGTTVLDQVDSKASKTFKNLLKYITPTTKALKKLWDEGLSRLGKFTWGSLKDFYKGFLVPIGKWTFGKGIPKFIDALNEGLLKTDFNKIQSSMKKLWDVLTPFSINIIGKGLLWFWENVLVPLGTWTANEVVPRFLDTLRIAVKGLNGILAALQPLFQWFWKNVLEPLASWTGGVFLKVWDGINDALEKFADWCTAHPGDVQTIAVAVGGFFAAWKVTELLSFIQQSGGVVNALKAIETALLGNITAKLTDKAETIYLTALYAKDFVISAGQSVVALGKQALGIATATAAKIADTAAQLAMTAATAAWNAVCGIATAATKALGTAVAFLTSPFGIAVIAIAAVIAAGVLLYKNWDTVCEWATKLKDWVVDKTCGMRDGATKAFDTLKTNCSNATSALKISVKEKWNAIKNILSSLWDALKSKADKIFNSIRSKVTGVWDSVKEKTSQVWENVTSFVSDKVETIKNAISDKFEAARDAVKAAFEGIVDYIKNPINEAIRIINGAIGTINNAIGSIESAFTFGPWTVHTPFGSKTIGFTAHFPRVGTIPQLAEGGFVQKNTPQLAMIGDNRHQGEIVAPEGKLQEMVDLAVAKAGTGNSDALTGTEFNRGVMRIVSALSEMGFYLDGTQMAKANRAAQEVIDIRYNTVGVR